jgi:hypothetical protein
MRASEAKRIAVEHADELLHLRYPEVGKAIQDAAENGALYAEHKTEVDSRLRDLLSTLGYGIHQHGSNIYSISF